MLISISGLLPLSYSIIHARQLSQTQFQKSQKTKPTRPELYAVLDTIAVILALFFQLRKDYQNDSK